MSYATGETANGFHLLRLTKMVFGSPLCSDVSGDGRSSHDAACGIANRRNGDRDVEGAAILGDADGFIMLDALVASEPRPAGATPVTESHHAQD